MRDPDDREPVLTVDVGADAHGMVLIVRGDLDLEGAAIVEDALVALGRAEPVRIDLDGIEFIDSSGIRLLIAQRAQRPLGILRPSSAVRRTFELAGVADLLDELSMVQPEATAG